jgi:lipopolysaccharide export system permease protein
MFKARIIKGYLFREMLTPFFVSLGVFTSVLLIAKIMELTELVVARGVGLDVVGRLLLYALPYFFVFTVPMATLLAVLLAFLRLSSDNEVTSMKAAGVGLHQLLPPVAAIAFMAWLMSSALAIWGLPWGNHNFENLIFKVAQSKADLALKERVFLDSFKNLVIYINRLPGEGVLQDVFIVDERDPNRVHTIVAKRGKLFPAKDGRITMRLYEGTIHGVSPDLKKAQTAEFETYDIGLDASGLLSAQRTSKHEKEMYLDELLAEMAKQKPGSKKLYLLQMELHKKFSLPFACFVLSLIALPLGTHTRSGRSWGVSVALGVFLLYYLMLSAAWSFGESGMYPPIVGMWMPNVVFGLLGIMMFRRELNEAPIPILDSLDALPTLIARFKSRGQLQES